VPNTYTQIYVHFVFAVKGRASLINQSWREELFKYVTGTIQNKRHKMIAVGGVEDHIHILAGVIPSEAISDLVRDVKVSSTLFINRSRFLNEPFRWQEGFGAFSVSRSNLSAVAKYVANQERHHSTQTFENEYKTMLEKHDVRYKEEYLFRWVDGRR